MLLFNTNNSIQHYSSICTQLNGFKYQSFVYIQLNDQTVLFQTIQFSISHLFAHSLNVKLLFDS